MIGGEFEINFRRQEEFEPEAETYYYASGRTALYQILRSLEPQREVLWMPDWLCYTMVEAVEKAGMKVKFYELNSDFKATVEALDRSGFCDGEAVLMVNYFGLQDLTEIAKTIKEVYPKTIVIEDDVQAYWIFTEKDNPYADYRFTSMRKAFAIPDGGLVKTKHTMPLVNNKNTFSPLKMKAGMMKWHRGEEGIRDEDYLALFRQGDALIRENYDSQMSEYAKWLFAGTDYDSIKLKRKSNAKHIVDGLKEFGMKPLVDVPEDSVPLFVPIYLGDRDSVRRRMFQNEVFCPVHWPLEGMDVKCGGDMAAHELSLIVDQRYGVSDMNQILKLLQ